MKFGNYRHYLLREFEKRKVRNFQYSLRAFARDLEVSPSRLSEAINEKRGISLDLANHLIEKLKLQHFEADIFRTSVESEHSRSPLQKSKAKAKLKKLLARIQDPQPMTFTVVDWVAEAVLKMSERETVTNQIDKIATAISVPEFMVVNAVRFLTRLGLIKGAKNFKTYLESRGAGRKLNVDYSQILEQALKAYSKNFSQDRFSHGAFLLEKDDIAKAHQIISNGFSEIQKLEKRSRNSQIVFIANQIFAVEKQRK